MRRTIFALALAAPLAGQVCEPSPQVRAAIDGAGFDPRIASPALTPAERLARATRVRAAFPDDYFANTFFQDAAGEPVPASVQAEYRTLRDLHPGNALYAMLYARALIGSDTKQAIPLLEALNYPPAGLELARIYSSGKFRDDAKLRAAFAGYENSCATSPEIYAYAGLIDDAAFARDHAAKLRNMIESRTDARSLHLYNLLWTMEFKTVPLAQQSLLRARVKRDAERLRAMGAENTAAMKSLARAYAILGDKEGTAWIAQHAAHALPSSFSEENRAVNRWYEAQGPRAQMYPPTQEFWRAQLEESAKWITQFPGEPDPWKRRFQALAALPDSKREDLEHAASEWMRLYELRGSEAYPPYSLYLDIARVYAMKDIHPEQVSGLIEKQVREVLEAVEGARSDLSFNHDSTGLMGLNAEWNTLEKAADLDIQLRRFDQAHDMLAKLAASIAGRNAGVFDYRYWYEMALLARGENHPLDAMTYLRDAIAADRRDASVPVDADYQATFGARHKKTEDDRAAEALALWKTLGGSEAAFQNFLNPPVFEAPPAPAAAPPKPNPWKTIGKALPDFTVTDAQGKTWNLADLKGKVTLINLWATWCEPCRAELPLIQKLYDQVQSSADLAVVTLNMDENTGLIEPYMKQNGFTFPVLPALEYERAFEATMSLPRTWIVNAGGILVEERIGAGLSGKDAEEHWVENTLAQMQKVRAAK